MTKDSKDSGDELKELDDLLAMDAPLPGAASVSASRNFGTVSGPGPGAAAVSGRPLSTTTTQPQITSTASRPVAQTISAAQLAELDELLASV